MEKIILVALDLKVEIIKDNIFTYSISEEILISKNDIGKLVRVPFSNRKLTGIIVDILEKNEYLKFAKNTGNLQDLSKLRNIIKIFYNLPKLDNNFFNLAKFAANYYHQPLASALCMSLPPKYKQSNFDENKEIQIKSKYLNNKKSQQVKNEVILNTEQQIALDKILASFDKNVNNVISNEISIKNSKKNSVKNSNKNFLLFGITGSGKTEIYLHLIHYVIYTLKKQVLILVPEINLTPQLEQQIFERFFYKNNENNENNNANELAVLHSNLTANQRDFYWRLAASGQAKIILGTRLAIFTPLPDLACIIVDEEHDLSFRQCDGFRYSARDLAVFRANNLQIPLVLGSASPSLETWYNATKTKRYQLLTLTKRANLQSVLPNIKLVKFLHKHNDNNYINYENKNNANNTNDIKKYISEEILEKIQNRLENHQQSLIFLNRRGYATALFCANCGWTSHCKHCDTNTVVHLQQQQLRCHHCGFAEKLPTCCPECGEQNIFPSGIGTQKLEELLQQKFPMAKIIRIDTDSVKNRQQWLQILENIHNSNADILIGTQMLVKGHDFPNLTLVAVLGADYGLFAGDPRAEEHIFAQLLQVAGRAGRADKSGEVLIQTKYPTHQLFLHLPNHNFAEFANVQLKIRQDNNFPPYSYQALLRANAKTMVVATNFLLDASKFLEIENNNKNYSEIIIYDPIPLNIAKLEDMNRAQLLVETQNRQLLHIFITNWIPYLNYLSSQYKLHQKLSWFIEIDPVEL